MHLVLVNQYYPPDEAPTGLMLEAVAEALVDAGHRVTVLCAAGGYAGASAAGENPSSAPRRSEIHVERIGATRFGRGTFAGKLADYASYYGGVAWKLLTLRPAPDRVVALTTPPYLSVLARAGSGFRGADHAHWVMDLYPDVMVAHGMLREDRLAHRVLAAVARWGFGGKRCAAVLTLGPDMADRVTRHLPAGKSADWVPLWGTGEGELPEGPRKTDHELEAEGRALRAARGWAEDELILMYSGNMGLGHRFGEFLAAARRLAARDPGGRNCRLVFFGGGKRRAEIESFLRQHPGAPVELHGYVPRLQLAAHLRSADVHLASLEPSWTGTMLPSKLQGIFAAARPVIFVGSPESSTAVWIRESGGGWVVPAGDDLALDAALAAAADPSRRKLAACAAAKHAAESFDLHRNSRRLAETFSR